MFVVAMFGLVGVPPFGTFVGKELIEQSASDVGYGWVVIVFVVASGLTRRRRTACGRADLPRMGAERRPPP